MHARPNSDSVLQTLTCCCCWKDLSLFLKREGSTKSHPLARKASSPLRSGSPRSDVSLIIMAEAETHNPRQRRIGKRPLKCGRKANVKLQLLRRRRQLLLLLLQAPLLSSQSNNPAQRPRKGDVAPRSRDTVKAARQRHGTGPCSTGWGFLSRARRSADPRRPSRTCVFVLGSLVPAAPSSAALGNMSHARLW